MYALVGVCQEYMPVAQTQVLRRVLKGGISTNSGRLVFFLSQYGWFFGAVLERWVGGVGGLVFGTLLGPEATGPGSSLLRWGSGLFVSGFLAALITHVCVWGVWFGVVV